MGYAFSCHALSGNRLELLARATTPGSEIKADHVQRSRTRNAILTFQMHIGMGSDMGGHRLQQLTLPVARPG
jgi:hypothetical protein